MGTKSIPEKNKDLDPNRNPKKETTKSADPKPASAQCPEKKKPTDS